MDNLGDTCPDCLFNKLACICSPQVDEDVERARVMLTPEDFDGGFHNVEPPPSFYEQVDRDAAEAAEFIIVNEGMAEMPHQSDGVNVTFTPEEMVVLIQILEQNATSSCCTVDYMRTEMNKNLYEQQGVVRQLRDNIDGTLDHYIRVRPFNPFLSPWVRRIGKKEVRRGED